ncbi:MAG: hypothetical protein AAB740_04935 [Patescibacteria group bacterium]
MRTPYGFIIVFLVVALLLGIALYYVIPAVQAVADKENERIEKQNQAVDELLGANTNMNPSHNVAGFIIFYKRVLL